MGQIGRARGFPEGSSAPEPGPAYMAALWAAQLTPRSPPCLTTSQSAHGPSAPPAVDPALPGKESSKGRQPMFSLCSGASLGAQQVTEPLECGPPRAVHE